MPEQPDHAATAAQKWKPSRTKRTCRSPRDRRRWLTGHALCRPASYSPPRESERNQPPS
jgi:hypothetical protein